MFLLTGMLMSRWEMLGPFVQRIKTAFFPNKMPWTMLRQSLPEIQAVDFGLCRQVKFYPH